MHKVKDKNLGLNTILLASLINNLYTKKKVIYLLFEMDKQDKFLRKSKQNNYND